MAPKPNSNRLERIDLLRTVAMVWMAAFHFCFDLNYFGVIEQNFNHDPLWTWQRSAIVSLFLFTAGLSQAVAFSQRQSWRRFWTRWAHVAGAAVLVTVGSMLMFPNSFIYFGVLHGIAVMLIVARLTAGWGAWLWPLGALAIAGKFVAPFVISALPALNVLNQPGFNALGFVSRLPITEDYVPVLPWLGVMWWGLAAGRWALVHRPHWLGGPVASAPSLPGLRALVVLGRWSLSFYLLHQPVLIGLVAAGVWLWR